MSHAGGGRFADLQVRVASGAVIAVLGLGAVWAGGIWFALLVGVAVAAMGWELAGMTLPRDSASDVLRVSGAAALGAVIVGASLWLAPLAAAGVAALPALALALWPAARPRAGAAAYLALICLAGHALIVLRGDFGLYWTIWLVLLVIGSDVAGYFAGRYLGGPKFWPRLSPKKTWSGTVAGWLLGAALGAAFMAPLGMGAGLALLSVAVVVAGQLGDIAESALKRRAGVKDSSALIPGHGGVMDRFDAMMAAALAFLVLARLGLVADGAGG